MKIFKHKKSGEIAIYKDGVLKSSNFCVEIGVEPSNEYWEEIISSSKSAYFDGKPKQETLEEAVLNSEEHNNLTSEDGSYLSFHKQSELLRIGAEIGAKWQQEQMHSEEDLHKAYCAGANFDMSCLNGEQYYMFKDWYKQFKKK
jgi:hypothetical protein